MLPPGVGVGCGVADDEELQSSTRGRRRDVGGCERVEEVELQGVCDRRRGFGAATDFAHACCPCRRHSEGAPLGMVVLTATTAHLLTYRARARAGATSLALLHARDCKFGPCSIAGPVRQRTSQYGSGCSIVLLELQRCIRPAVSSLLAPGAGRKILRLLLLPA